MDYVKWLGVIVGINYGLIFAKAGLDAIKDKTEATWDNKLADVLGLVCGLSSKLIDVVTGKIITK